MSLVVKGGEPKTIQVEDGLHFGVISRLEERTPPGKDYSYLDVFISCKDSTLTDLELKTGYPLPKKDEGIHKKMVLGKLVKRFTGSEVVKDTSYDLEAILNGKEVQFVTLQNNEGYTEIQKDSLKPKVNSGVQVKSEEKKIPVVD